MTRIVRPGRPFPSPACIVEFSQGVEELVSPFMLGPKTVSQARKKSFDDNRAECAGEPA